MAEFKEVIKQYNRVCEAFNDGNCQVCPLNASALNCEDWMLSGDNPEAVEKIIMDWAVAHPEPQYPTWIEWCKETFPSAYAPVDPCTFISKEQAGCNGKINCIDCRNEPIPAEIAEKLGVLPKGVK